MKSQFTTEAINATTFRNIGPPRGGRVVAVAGDPFDRNTFYFGACAGGVWKTTTAGQYWECVSDGYLGSAAVGALEVAPSDRNVLYVGMGESEIRGNVCHGDGVYRSSDAGLSWQHLGLADSRFISRIQVDPLDPDLVYVAALGNIWKDSAERGVYRSRDGGAHWEHVLPGGKQIGAADLAMDASNPRVLFASLWEAHRRPWTLSSGGPGSGLHRSMDGGNTWHDITTNPGFPKAIKGRIGVAVSPARRGRVWAQVEAADKQGGLYRSEDYGETWHRINAEKRIGMRPFYYMHVHADPQDGDTVWVINLETWRSTDGGKSFTEIPAPHLDCHGLWIDPKDSQRIIASSDGGAYVSFNGGGSWSSIYNQPTAQFYNCDVTNEFPYKVFGTQQDNTAVGVPSRTSGVSINWRDCDISVPSESGQIVAKPDAPHIIVAGGHGYNAGGGGGLMVYNQITGETLGISPKPELTMGDPADAKKPRFQWTFPVMFSTHDSNVLYACGERVYRTEDLGMNWQEISRDLSYADPDKMGSSGGRITQDNTAVEIYCTIFSFAESLHDPAVLMAGTDDGRVHLTRNGGKSWSEVTPPNLKKWTTVATIEPSPHHPGTFYLAAQRYRLGDNKPYLARTRNYGKTWERIDKGLVDGDIMRVIRCDPTVPNLLYAGSERGLVISTDGGTNWLRCPKVPVVPVHDLKVRDEALVVATHGRGFWICDDLAVLRTLPKSAPKKLHVFTSAPAYRFGMPTDEFPLGFSETRDGQVYTGDQSIAGVLRHKDPEGQTQQRILAAGTNPRYGAVLTYYLPESLTPRDSPANGGDQAGTRKQAKAPTGKKARSTAKSGTRTAKKAAETKAANTPPELKLRILDDDDQEIAAFSSQPEGKTWPKLPVEKGFNSFAWKLQAAGARPVVPPEGEIPFVPGPPVPPGTYQMEFTLEGKTAKVAVEVRNDPRLPHSAADHRSRYALALENRELMSAINDRVTRVRAIKTQMENWRDRLGENHKLTSASKKIIDKLTEAEKKLVNPEIKAFHDQLEHPPALSVKLSGLSQYLSSGDSAPPTAAARELLDDLRGRVEQVFAELDRLIDRDVANWSKALAKTEPALIDVDWTGRKLERKPD